MVVSFKVSKTGTRPKPKPKPDPVTPPQHEEDVHNNNINNNQFAVSAAKAKAKPKPSVDVAENGRDDSEISDADISFFTNLFPDGYSIGNPSENRIVVQDDPKFLHPYDRTSESLFLAIERGLLPADFLDDIPCKYNNGAVACEVRDYRNSASEPGVNNGSSADSSRPITTKIRLKMSLENVVKDIPLISDSSWTYGDLMEAEARILMALNPKLDINPTPNIDRLCRPPTCTNLNLNIRELRRKRLRQMAGPDNSVNGKKICIDRFSENQNSALMVQPSDFVNSTGQNVVPASPSLSYQSKYQIGSGNPRVMQDHGSAPVQDMMNSYPESMNSTLGKRENQDSQLSSMTGLTKRARSNSMGLDGGQQQMDGLNSLMQQQQHQQSVGRGIQLPYNGGMQKYPFDGSFNQESFTMGQPGLRYNLKQEPVDPELNRNMQMVDSDVDPRLQQQRLNQQFQRSSFPPTPWNALDNSRKEEQFQRRKSAQSPRVSSGTLPQSPLSSKSGEFSSGSHGAQYGAPQRDKSAVTSVPTVGGAGSLTSNAQMAARRSTSLPKTPAAMSGVGSPASVSNISGAGPFNASSPLIGKEADKSIRDKFSKIEMLTARYQLNMKKNKVDEYIENTSFSTQQLNHHLFNDLNNENPKDEEMPLSKSLVGGSMNVCKTRVLIFEQKERVHQGNGFSVSKSRTRLILSEKRDDGTVAMHYGELDDCDYLASEESLPTLPNTHVADLLAAQFQTLILREGYELAGDHLQPKPANTVRSSGDQPNNNPSGVLSPKIEMSDTVSGNEIAKPSDSGNNNNNASVNLSGARMHPPANSQPMPISQGGSGLLPPARPMQPESQPSFQQNQHNLMQQQMQRSSAMMLASNPLSHLNAMGQNSNMQQLGHMLNKTTPLQLQMLQQQQQQQQQPQMQRKMMMGLGNVGMGGNTGNSMVGLQGMGNNIVGLQGMGANRGISPPMSGVLSGMGNNMGQSSINMNQASNISNVISQQLRNGVITPVQAQMMNAKLRMVQQNRAMMGGAGGQSGNITGLPGANRQMHPGSSNYSMLGPGMNRANNVNPMQRTAMAPPKLMSGMNAGMNAYMNQSQQLPNQQQQQQMHVQQQQQQQMPHQQQQQQLPHQNQQLHQQQQQQQQESSSPLQAVLSPPQQQVGSPSMGLQQQASPQQMSQRTPMSPQLSSGAIHPQMSAGNQEANCPASPQLSSQTMGSVSSMTNSPMDMQGVNKSS